MNAPSRQELSLMLVWAFREQEVESSPEAHIDALTLYHNVMALPVEEAAAIITCARSGNIPPTDPLMLARWTRGMCWLRDLVQQPLCELQITKLKDQDEVPSVSAA